MRDEGGREKEGFVNHIVDVAFIARGLREEGGRGKEGF